MAAQDSATFLLSEFGFTFPFQHLYVIFTTAVCKKNPSPAESRPFKVKGQPATPATPTQPSPSILIPALPCDGKRGVMLHDEQAG